VLLADVVDPHTPLRHDPEKLADVLMRLYAGRADERSRGGEPVARVV
jgi:hypothetical protein